jgi:DNA-binding response OmpR family regulator
LFFQGREKRKTMKKRILLVDDEVAVLLTLKAVLEINGFDVDTAASGREGKLKLRANEYHMVISDMRMESDQAGAAVIAAARSAPYKPAVALLTAYPVTEEDWQEMGADRMLVKPMHTRLLLEQIDRLMKMHDARRYENGNAMPVGRKAVSSRSVAAGTKAAKKAETKKTLAKTPAKKSVSKRTKKAIKRPATKA